MPLTLEQLRSLCQTTSAERLEAICAPLNDALAEFEIDTSARQSAFLAQVAHESGCFRYLRELASGDAYEGNVHLGNTEPGDGRRFKGRGLIQITGRKNYHLCGDALGLDLLAMPELLEQPAAACRSAGWFWRIGAGLNLSARAKEHGVPEYVDLNDLADQGDFEGITLAINGGLNGYEDRLAQLHRAQTALT
jgi:putative chitinase